MVSDRYHKPATRHWRHLLDTGAEVLTSDYVLDETLTRLRYDFSLPAALRFWNLVEASIHQKTLKIHRVDEACWLEALGIFRRYDDQVLSFTDCTSFVLARTLGVDEVFAFDQHFPMFGLATQPPV